MEQESTTKALCNALEAAMASKLEVVRKDQDRERHFRQRVKKGLADVQDDRRYILKLDPHYVFAVKVPRFRKQKDPDELPRGHYTNMAKKVMRELKRGTFAELKERALEQGLVQAVDVEPLRQALYQLKRKGKLEFVTDGTKGGGVFVGPVRSSKRAEALSPHMSHPSHAGASNRAGLA